MVMAYFMLIVDFSYALQAVMNIIMILLNNYFFEFALLHTSILLISFLFYKKNPEHYSWPLVKK